MSMVENKPYRLDDRHDQVEFNGVLLGTATTETATSTRWTEISIYRTETGTYVIHRVGHSVLYHQSGGGCNEGVPVKVASITDEDLDLLVPCDKCNPPDDLEDDMTVDRELTRNNIDECPLPGDVADQLKLTKKGEPPYMSMVAQRALAAAMAADQDLRSSITVRRIS